MMQTEMKSILWNDEHFFLPVWISQNIVDLATGCLSGAEMLLQCASETRFEVQEVLQLGLKQIRSLNNSNDDDVNI